MENPDIESRLQFEEQLPLIEDVICKVSRAGQMPPDDVQEFRAYSFFRFVSSGYAAFHRFEGRSCLKTYLTTIIRRFLLDYRTLTWGRWRPSSKARRLGDTAIALEQKIEREGLTQRDAVGQLSWMAKSRAEISPSDLEELAEKLPNRPRRQLVGLLHLMEEPGRVTADGRSLARESRSLLRDIRGLLSGAMTKLSDEDQKILRLRFFQGFSVATIARSLDLDQRRLYHRFDKSLHFLKKELQRHRHLVEDLSELLAEGTPLHKIEEEAHG